MAPWLLLAGSRGPANCKVFLLGGGDLDLKNIKNMIEKFKKNILKSKLSFGICLFESTPSRRKEMGIPLEILPDVRGQNKRSYFPRPGQS